MDPNSNRTWSIYTSCINWVLVNSALQCTWPILRAVGGIIFSIFFLLVSNVIFELGPAPGTVGQNLGRPVAPRRWPPRRHSGTLLPGLRVWAAQQLIQLFKLVYQCCSLIRQKMTTGWQNHQEVLETPKKGWRHLWTAPNGLSANSKCYNKAALKCDSLGEINGWIYWVELNRFTDSIIVELEKRRPIGRFSLGPAGSCLGFAQPVCFCFFIWGMVAKVFPLGTKSY